MKASRAAGLAAGVALGAALGGLLLRGCPKDWGPACAVRGRVLGPARQVVAVQSGEGFLRAASLDPASGRFEVAVPRAVPEPWIVVHGQGGARVETSPLRELTGEGLELPPVALWETPFRVRREGERLRWDWSPVPEREGFPARRRYSLLFEYPRAGDPPRGQTSLLSFDPAIELPLSELLDQMPELSAPEAEVVVELRVLDPADPTGALWVGARAAWKLGSTELRPLPD